MTLFITGPDPTLLIETANHDLKILCKCWEAWDRRSPWHINVELEEEFEPQEWSGPGAAGKNASATWPRLSVADLALWLKEIHGKFVMEEIMTKE